MHAVACRGTVGYTHPLSSVEAASCGSRDDAYAAAVLLYDLLSGPSVAADLRRQLLARAQEPGFAEELFLRCSSVAVRLQRCARDAFDGVARQVWPRCCSSACWC